MNSPHTANNAALMRRDRNSGFINAIAFTVGILLMCVFLTLISQAPRIISQAVHSAAIKSPL